MPRREKPTYNGITFDSDEEREVYWWAEEALDAKLITAFQYQSPTFVLAEKAVDDAGKLLFRSASYTCDFHFEGIAPGIQLGQHVDVKPKFERRHDRKQVFALNQKWVYYRYGVVVHPLKPMELFAATFAPLRTFTTQKKRQARKNYVDFRRCEEFCEALSQESLFESFQPSDEP